MNSNPFEHSIPIVESSKIDARMGQAGALVPTQQYCVPASIHRWLYQVLEPLPLQFQLDLWGQTVLQVNPDQPTAIALVIHHPGVLRTLLLSQDLLTLVDAYLQGWLDVVGDLATLIPLVQHHPHAQLSLSQSLSAWLAAWTLPALPTPIDRHPVWQPFQQGTHDRDRAAVQHHYDTGNAFYRLWLDSEMVYSCAYFEQPQMGLEAAQRAKLDRICHKLRLTPGETLLDIGCGWGALLRWAATHYGVNAYGITLSQEQYDYNQDQIAQAGLGDQMTVALLDYRDLPQQPRFDKIVSIGMVEHVGVQNYPLYFRTILATLKPGGLFLNHGITSRDRWNNSSLGERFIDRYIFPEGRLAQLSTLLAAAETAGWEIVDVESWRPHYAQTLWWWVNNFEVALESIKAAIGDRRAELWRLYLMGSALGFEQNYMGIEQTLLRRKVDRFWDLPLTRTNWLC